MLRRVRLLALSLSLLFSVGIQSCADAYTGNRWSSLEREQRVGFIAGYIDCDVFVLKGPLAFPSSWHHYEKRLTEYFKDHPAEGRRSVTEVLDMLSEQSDTRDEITCLMASIGDRQSTHIDLALSKAFWNASIDTRRRGLCTRRRGTWVAYRSGME